MPIWVLVPLIAVYPDRCNPMVLGWRDVHNHGGVYRGSFLEYGCSNPLSLEETEKIRE